MKNLHNESNKYTEIRIRTKEGEGGEERKKIKERRTVEKKFLGIYGNN